ncbi:MAG: hypothetical protein KIT17_09695 [Rubrivivax sp.]|nr:hypothetical protein [Rubrivivax sp.]
MRACRATHAARLAAATAGLALAAWAMPAAAADAVTDAMQAAYAPYRAALFRTNSKAQPESEQAIAAARTQWRALADRFAARPAPPYDRDADFAATLKQVDEVYARAEAQIAARQLPEAHETLEKARDLMAELRRRNGVVVFSDHMNAYHEQMEHVLVDGAKMLAQPGGLLELAAQAGTLDHLAKRLAGEAPAALTKDAEFKGALDAVLGSVRALRAAITRQDEAAVREAIGKLKGPYSRMFLKYG